MFRMQTKRKLGSYGRARFKPWKEHVVSIYLTIAFYTTEWKTVNKRMCDLKSIVFQTFLHFLYHFAKQD